MGVASNGTRTRNWALNGDHASFGGQKQLLARFQLTGVGGGYVSENVDFHCFQLRRGLGLLLVTLRRFVLPLAQTCDIFRHFYWDLLGNCLEYGHICLRIRTRGKWSGSVTEDLILLLKTRLYRPENFLDRMN